METEKFNEAVKDETFARSIVDMKSPEEVKKAFASKDVEISLDEAKMIISTIEKMISKNSTELSEEDLNEIAGGKNIVIAGKTSLAMAAALGAMLTALSLAGLYDIYKKKRKK